MPAADSYSTGGDAAVRSHTVTTDAVTWKVLEAGEGPPCLLLHGTGSSTHSWRGLLPLMARRFHIIAPDLPGHGDSVLHDDNALSLDGMSRAVARLLQKLDVTAEIVVGHSAGAALAARAMLDGRMYAGQLVSINGAFVPFGGAAGQLFAPMARVFASSGLLAQFIARRARAPQSVERLLASTGSKIGDDYVEDYRRLFASPDHVAATLGMMANWDLWTLQRDLPRLAAQLILLVGTRDGTVPPAQAQQVAAAVAGARLVHLKGLGHMAHEEAPDTVASVIFESVAARTSNSR